jgi:hypothetical protein
MPENFVPTTDGRWVSAEYARMAQIIADYDPSLELAWVPDGNRYIALRIKETEFDHRILARLWQADAKNGNVLDRLDAEDAAIRAVEMQKQIEKDEEARELAAWMIKAPVGARHNGIRLE